MKKKSLINGILYGLAKVLKVTPQRYNYDVTTAEAMASDWKAVGDDIRKAIYSFENKNH